MREEALGGLGDGSLQNLVLGDGARDGCNLDVKPCRGCGVSSNRNFFLQGSALPWKYRSFRLIDRQFKSLFSLG